MGDNMPDFSSMTPEEQMRWLESLAKRQGAGEGFTTSADMEVDELNPDDVDESNFGPGYTPSETFSFSKHNDEPPASEAASPPPEASPLEQTPAAEVPQTSPALPEDSPAQPAASVEQPDMESLSSSDPMAFLEALAARQGADPNTLTSQSKMEVPELDESSVDQSNFGPGYTPSETFSWSKTDDDMPAAPPEPPVEEAETLPGAGGSGELDMEALANSDPVAFMRALAARQGADPATLGEGDDSFAVPELDESSVDQSNFGPGYTPSETFSWSKTDDDASIAPPEPPEAAPPESPATPAATGESFADEELQAEADPMQWLNSLAGNQEDDLFDAAEDDLFELQEVDPQATDFEIDEQQDTRGIEAILDAGVTGPPDAPFAEPPEAAAPPQPLAEMPTDQPPPAPYADTETADAGDTMSWLEDLAEDQGAEVSDFLNEMTDAEDALPGFDLEYDDDADEGLSLDFTEQPAAEMDLISGLSDDDIAQMQRDGTITPEQELAWLTQKAEQLSELHNEDEDFDIHSEITDEIEPAEMPAWLQAQMPGALDVDDAIEDSSATFVESIVPPDEPDDLPSWLSADDDAELIELELDELELEDTSQVEPIATGVPDTELELSENVLADYDPSLDHWTEALDQEFEGKPSEVDEIYEAAAEQVEQEMAASTMATAEQAPATETEFIDELDWLSEPDTALAIEDDGEMPAWLRPSVESESSDISAWLREQQMGGPEEAEGIGWMTEPVPDVDSEDLSWLAEPIEADGDATPVPQAAAPAPAAQPLAPVEPVETLSPGVDGELPDWYLRKIGVVVGAPTAVPQQTRRAAPHRPPTQTPPPTPPLPQRDLVPVTEIDGLMQAIQQNPDDHQARLRLARGLSDNQRLNEGLQHYETLVNKLAVLDSVADDLNNIINQVAQHPKARRLLGDVYMRQGRLQEALDTYRGALSQI